MQRPPDPVLPIEQKLALSHASGMHFDALSLFLQLDRRLGQFVSQSKEPMLTQMRLAWWRDQFGKPVSGRPNGDPVLDDLSRIWSGEENALIALVNGWEALLTPPPLGEEAALEFATGRAACFAAMARLADVDPANASHCGAVWAFADLVSRMSDTDEIAVVRDLAQEQCARSMRLPFRLRSLTILGFLGRKALARGGGPFITGRRDLAHVFRIGMFAR